MQHILRFYHLTRQSFRKREYQHTHYFWHPFWLFGRATSQRVEILLNCFNLLGKNIHLYKKQHFYNTFLKLNCDKYLSCVGCNKILFRLGRESCGTNWRNPLKSSRVQTEPTLNSCSQNTRWVSWKFKVAKFLQSLKSEILGYISKHCHWKERFFTTCFLCTFLLFCYPVKWFWFTKIKKLFSFAGFAPGQAWSVAEEWGTQAAECWAPNPTQELHPWQGLDLHHAHA
jgi:hypothetical protein